ncbi:MAG TPA: hypothetical protein VF546_07460 [Pyrinomonadaceae bacterium]|jgi:predicted lipid-binding transport protein (Tim44 family)
MRQLLTACALAAACAAAACNPEATTNNTTTTTNTTTTSTAPPAAQQPAQQPAAPPISTAHGGGGAAAGPAAASERPTGVDTAALDEKIEKLEAKIKANGTAADRKALASVYLQRANVYRDAGSPQLYKFALGDYRRVLKYDPANAEAKDKMDEIVSIYQSMGRPVPTNGLDQ